MKNIFKEIGFPFPENAKYIQKEKGLTVDGIVGAKTWKALLQ